MDGFLKAALQEDQVGVRDCEDSFAEAIVIRDYNAAHALLTPGLQLEISEHALRDLIENHCESVAAAHGYDGFHHPIDFVISRQVSLKVFNQNLEQPVTLEVDHEYSKLVTIEFYPRAHLEFEVFFELILVVHQQERIAHLEIRV
jgi:hypothetical protein